MVIQTLQKDWNKKIQLASFDLSLFCFVINKGMQGILMLF
jgi:hypothetical protein